MDQQSDTIEERLPFALASQTFNTEINSHIAEQQQNQLRYEEQFTKQTNRTLVHTIVYSVISAILMSCNIAVFSYAMFLFFSLRNTEQPTSDPCNLTLFSNLTLVIAIFHVPLLVLLPAYWLFQTFRKGKPIALGCHCGAFTMQIIASCTVLYFVTEFLAKREACSTTAHHIKGLSTFTIVASSFTSFTTLVLLIKQVQDFQKLCTPFCRRFFFAKKEQTQETVPSSMG